MIIFRTHDIPLSRCHGSDTVTNILKKDIRSTGWKCKLYCIFVQKGNRSLPSSKTFNISTTCRLRFHCLRHQTNRRIQRIIWLAWHNVNVTTTYPAMSNQVTGIRTPLSGPLALQIYYETAHRNKTQVIETEEIMQ